MKDKQYFLTLFFILILTGLSYYFGSGEQFEIGSAVITALLFIVGNLFVSWYLKHFKTEHI
jgi:positive regulator of sigma E activity